MRAAIVARAAALAALAASAASLTPRTALAAPTQKLPFSFDPSIAADPAATQSSITSAENGLPDLPLASMTKTTVSGVDLWFDPTTATTLARAGASGPALDAWPSDVTMCTKHAAFTLPALVPAGTEPSGACATALSTITNALADTGACLDVEHAERYVLSAPPAKVDNTTTDTLEHLIGLAGEALSHANGIPANLLPADFVQTARTIVAKLRNDTLVTRIADANARYGQASSALAANAACFDATAKASLTQSLADFDKELVAAAAYLTKLKTDGQTAAAHQALCLQSKARARPALPFPSLTDDERKFLAFWLGGVYWRMRGGFMPLGSTQSARLYFLEAPFTRIGELTNGKDGSDAAFQIYLQIFNGWGDWMDMGRTAGGGDKYYDLANMTARGHQQVSSAIDLLAPKSYDTLPLDVGGLQMGPCYFYAWEQIPTFAFAQGLPDPPYGTFIGDVPTTIGEFCTGASIALGFATTMLEGADTHAPPTVNLCANRECGDDGCGTSCGTCSGGNVCSAIGHCIAPDGGACTPSCAGAACNASDGCGGTCTASCDWSSSGASGGPSSTPNEDASADASPSSSTGGCTTATSSSPTTPLALALGAAALSVALRRRRHAR